MLCLGLVPAAAVAADDAGPQRLLTLEPRLELNQTFSDNHDQSSTRAESDAITRMTAGIGLRGRGGVVRGYLDYALSSLVYARHSSLNELQNALSANLSADLIDNRLSLRAAASISRTAISAFGVQPGGGADTNANTTELRSLQLSPSLRGTLGPGLRYTAALTHAVSSAADTGTGDSDSSSATLRLEPVSAGKLGWSLDASQQRSGFQQGRDSRSERLIAGLHLDLQDADLRLHGSAGAERTNLSSLDPRSYSTWGIGAEWAPSPITKVSADLEDRFFGRSYSLSVEHRTPRTVFRYRNARSLSTNGSQVAGQQGQAFELFFNRSDLVATFPDDVLRRVYVNALLRALGIDPNRTIDTGFLASAATLQNLQELSAAWSSPRNTALLLLSRSKTRRVDTLSNALDDLSNTDEVQLSSLSFNLSHRLTPLSSLTLVLGRQRSNGSQPLQSNRQSQIELQYSVSPTPRSTAGVTLRRSQYNTAQVPYSENALSASYGLRF